MEVTQPGPFKEAWYHDFAPPIQSLDRHGDFAPPLLALGLAAGFFGVGTGGNGLQYHSAEVYGPHNIGDWLSVETTSTFVADFGDARTQEVAPGMLFKSDSVNGAGSGIVFWSHDTVLSRDPVWQLYPGGLIYFMDGQDDAGYSEGGQILRYSGGGQISFYTSESIRPLSGDFGVFTNGTSDDSATTTGSVTFDTSNSVGGAGNLEVKASGLTPGYVRIRTADAGLPPDPGDVSVTVADGSKFVVNDHLGSPLVTYTG